MTWIAVDLAALVLVAAVFARRDRRSAYELRPLVLAQMVVIASAIVAASTPQEPLRSYAEWTLMVAVNFGYALALITLKSFSSIIVIAIGLVFAVGALFIALVQPRQVRARA